MDARPVVEPLHFVTLSYVLPLFNCLKDANIPVVPLLASLNLSENDLINPDARFDHAKLNAMWALAEELTNDPNIGLHAGMNMQIAHIGMLGHLILTCERGGETFDFVTRFNNLVCNGDVLEFEQGRQDITLRCTAAEQAVPYGRHHQEYNAASWVTLARWVSSTDNKSTAIYFPCSAPPNGEEQRAFFGCELYYGQGSSLEIVVPAEYADYPLMAAEPTLRKALEAAARERLLALQGVQTDKEPLLAQLKQYIVETLYQGAPSLESAAAHLGSSPRALQRELERFGSNYKQLLEQVRQDRARVLIKEAELSLVDVALMLGFSEQSSFQRAFKRWFGQTPGQFRTGLGL